MSSGARQGSVHQRKVEADSPTEVGTASRQRGLSLVIALCVLPIGLDVGLPFQIGFADIGALILVPYLLSAGPRSSLFQLYVVLGFLSVCLVLTVSIRSGNPVLPPLQSLAYYVKPWLIFFAAARIVLASPSPYQLALRLFRVFAWAEVFLLALIIAGLGYEGSLVASGETVAGVSTVSFTAGTWDLPLKLYGYGQVNTIAALVFLATPLFLHRSSVSSGISRLAWLSAVPLSWSILALAGSRGALLAVAIFSLLSLLSRRAPRGGAAGLAQILAITVSIVCIASFSGALIELSPKYGTTLEYVRDGRFADATSGRADLNSIMMEDIRTSPLSGTAFYDFSRFHSAGFQWLESSPHNQYLGALHKGGLIIGVGFLYLIVRATPWRRLAGGAQELEWLTTPLAVALAVALLPVMDPLTSPVLAALILSIYGVIHGLREYGLDREFMLEPASHQRSNR